MDSSGAPDPYSRGGRSGDHKMDHSSWERRRLDELRDERIDRIEVKVDLLSARFYMGIGVLSVVVMVANIFGPVIAKAIIGGPQ